MNEWPPTNFGFPSPKDAANDNMDFLSLLDPESDTFIHECQLIADALVSADNSWDENCRDALTAAIAHDVFERARHKG